MRKERERERERVMKRCFSVCGDEKREKGFKVRSRRVLSKRYVLKLCGSGSGNYEDGEWGEDGDGGEGDDFFGGGGR